MVFSSVPVYLDPPNWQQQPNQRGVGNENPHLPGFTASHHAGVTGGVAGSSTRPGSLADRARIAKLPQPEAALKCPRCESTNTKFCYYNNYSLSQPRHFCKTCRRYWTKGGALRNVPVGGGCRRNKKTKNQSNSKSPASGERQVGSSSTISTSAIASEMIGHLPQHPTHHQLPFMTPLHNLTQFGVGNFGLNFTGASGQADTVGFQMGSNSGISNSIGVQQFPFIEPVSTGLYPFQSHEGVEAMTSSSRVSQSAPVKMEENHGLNIPRPFLGITENNQYWGGNSWTDLPGLNPSSTSHLL